MLNYRDQIKAQFAKQAADLALLPQIDETSRQIAKHSQKGSSLFDMKMRLLKLIENAYIIERDMFRMSSEDIIASKSLTVLIDHISKRVINANPTILKPLIRREAAYFVTGQVHGSLKEFNVDQFIEDPNNNIIQQDTAKLEAWFAESTRTDRKDITKLTDEAFMDELDTLQEMYQAQPTGRQISIISHIVRSKLLQQLKDVPQDLVEDIVNQYADMLRSGTPPSDTVQSTNVPLNPKGPF